MSLIKILDFQSATGLTDATMFRLIKAAPAWLKLDQQSGLLIDSDSVEIKDIINAVAKVDPHSDESLVSAMEQRILEFFYDLMARRSAGNPEYTRPEEKEPQEKGRK